MPSRAHEILVELFQNRPSLAAEMLAEVLGVTLPAYTEARLASADLTAQPAENRADIIVLLLDGAAPVRVIIVEVQLAADPRKRLSWPAHMTASRATHACPAGLLVVAPDAAVAGWCAEPIEIGIPGFVLSPPVLHRSNVPVVTDVDEAVRRPELGVLSAMSHGESGQAAAIVEAVLPAIRQLDDERAKFYCDLVCNSLNEAARLTMEVMMKGYQYQSDFAKRYVAEGRDEGWAVGWAEGLAEGLAEGETREAARSLLAVLQARGISVPDVVRQRIEAQKGPERLRRWLDRAAVTNSLAAVLDEPS